MKVIVFLLLAVVVGYTSGLMAESAVEGEYSKVQSLVNSGEFDERWIPFSLSQKINEFTATYGVLSASMGFLENAEMMDPMINAEIDFIIETATREAEDGSKYLVNRISECVFQADDLILTSCIICLLKDDTGTLIAKGQTDVGNGFEGPGDGPLSIPLMEFLDNDVDITDVRNVHGVELAICGDGEGCSAKFWEKNKKQWPSSLDPKDKFKDVFDIDSEIKIKKKTDPTLQDALKAKGKTSTEFLAREATAALLNAEHISVPYLLDSADIKVDTKEAIDFGDEDDELMLAGIYADLNEKGCLLEKCKCSGVTSLSLLYDGPFNVPVDIIVKDITTFENVLPGVTIVVLPPNGEFKSNTIFEITDNNGLDETIAIHTSCSRSIGVGDVNSDEFTSLTITDLDQTFKSQKGEVCPLAPLKCKGVVGMTLEYFRDSPVPVTITVHEKATDPPFATFTGVIMGDTIKIDAPTDLGKDELKSNTIFKIFDESFDPDKLFETATKHTSCSKPIAVGDVVGTSMKITELDLKFD